MKDLALLSLIAASGCQYEYGMISKVDPNDTGTDTSSTTDDGDGTIENELTPFIQQTIEACLREGTPDPCPTEDSGYASEFCPLARDTRKTGLGGHAGFQTFIKGKTYSTIVYEMGHYENDGETEDISTVFLTLDDEERYGPQFKTALAGFDELYSFGDSMADDMIDPIDERRYFVDPPPSFLACQTHYVPSEERFHFVDTFVYLEDDETVQCEMINPDLYGPGYCFDVKKFDDDYSVYFTGYNCSGSTHMDCSAAAEAVQIDGPNIQNAVASLATMDSDGDQIIHYTNN